jgi:hypothetical protein
MLHWMMRALLLRLWPPRLRGLRFGRWSYRYMSFYSKLTRDYEDYLIRLVFGPKVESYPLSVCVDTAYLDFNRTLHGIGQLANGEKLHEDAVEVLTKSLTELKEALKLSMDQTKFDNWHEATCAKLIAAYTGSHTVYGGQAQKWVNMTLKYVYTLGEQRISGFEGAYPYCHAPLDNIVIDGLAKYSFPALSCAWSRLDYQEYFDRQKWIRNKFALVPLDVEFLLWLGKAIELKHLRKDSV